MEAKDLMIGDWVFNTLNGEDEPHQMKPHEFTMDGLIYSARPIPLTPEILEKNGFRYTNNHTLKGADTYVLHLEQRGFDYTITIKLNDYFALDSLDDRVYRLAEISTGMIYVHQLQHCLRLVRIEKEIVL